MSEVLSLKNSEELLEKQDKNAQNVKNVHWGKLAPNLCFRPVR